MVNDIRSSVTQVSRVVEKYDNEIENASPETENYRPVISPFYQNELNPVKYRLEELLKASFGNSELPVSKNDMDTVRQILDDAHQDFTNRAIAFTSHHSPDYYKYKNSPTIPKKDAQYEIMYDAKLLFETLNNLFFSLEEHSRFLFDKKAAEDDRIIIPHKLRWDNGVKPFDTFFKGLIYKEYITLMDGGKDSEIILSILRETFTIQEYGIFKNRKKIDKIQLNSKIKISQKLKWASAPKYFAEEFAPLISNNSETVIFINREKRGERSPIVHILYEIFFIPQEGNDERMAESTIQTYFKNFS